MQPSKVGNHSLSSFYHAFQWRMSSRAKTKCYIKMIHLLWDFRIFVFNPQMGTIIFGYPKYEILELSSKYVTFWLVLFDKNKTGCSIRNMSFHWSGILNMSICRRSPNSNAFGNIVCRGIHVLLCGALICAQSWQDLQKLLASYDILVCQNQLGSIAPEGICLTLAASWQFLEDFCAYLARCLWSETIWPLGCQR